MHTDDENRNWDLLDENFNPTVIRGKQYSPVIATDSFLEDIALEMALMVEENQRAPFQFNNFIVAYEMENDEQFFPPCHIDKRTKETPFLIELESSSKQSGYLNEDLMKQVVNTKSICQQCPLQKQCLATSLTGVQLARTSDKDRVIPLSSPPLVINEYLISGGFTPQERAVVFDKMCDILESWDDMYDE